MKPLQDFIGLQLNWVHPRLFKREYELHAGDEILAILRWEGSFNPQIHAIAQGSEWFFKREGFFRNEIAIYSAESATAIGVMKRNMGGKGTLQLANGNTFKWTSMNFWTNKWAWLTSEESTVMDFSRGKSLEISPTAFALTELPLLVTFGYYLIKLREQENAAAASAATT